MLTIVGIATIVALGLLVARNITVPLDVLIEFTEHVARGETGYDVGERRRHKVRRKDEIGRIGYR